MILHTQYASCKMSYNKDLTNLQLKKNDVQDFDAIPELLAEVVMQQELLCKNFLKMCAKMSS